MTEKTLQIRAYEFLHMPLVKGILTKLPGVRRVIYGGWRRAHPIDRQHGIETSGFVSVEKISSLLAEKIIPYAGSQPSIIRRALDALPDLADYSLIDLGCGKGRVTIVAAEYPFREIIGVELSPDLARIARSNAAKLAGKLPSASRIQIVEGDATTFRPDGKKIVFFTYHAFGAELMRAFLKSLEASLEDSIEHCFFIYYNPVCGSVFDASAALTRWFAEDFPYDASELGFGPDIRDSVVIWQSLRNALPPRQPGRERKIIAVEELKAVVAA